MGNKQLTGARQLKDLVSVGQAALNDFEILGIATVNSLAEQDAETLYMQLCKITGKQHDICVQDVFSAAIAQARNPNLPRAQCQWWYWSRLRKKEYNLHA